MHSPLLCIDLILRHQTLGLQDVGPIIADFLGPSRSLPLHEACHYSSTKLLHWMWTSGRSAAADCNDSNWSLSRYLHSDVHYYQWQFSEALEVAVSRGDFEIVKWLFEHFEACEVAVEVVEAAAKDGQLEILQFLLEHDAGGEKKDVKSGDHCIRTKNLVELTHVVHWGGRSLVEAVENGHAAVARWLWRYSPGGYGEADTAIAIKAALRVGDMKLAELLLPQDKCVLDYAEFCSHPDIIEWQLDCGYLQRDGLRSAIALKDLVRPGRLDLMKRIATLNDPPPEGSDWRAEWRAAMVHACVHGDRAILQWLMEHPAGRWTCAGDERLHSELVFSAAYKGNVEVMEYLFERGAIDKVRDGLLHAVREGHFDMVKWLVEHFPESERIPDYCVLDEAARYGRLEILKYFQALQPSTVPGYSPVAASPSRRTARNSREETFKMFVPASDDYLKVHQALGRYRTEWLATEAMDDAAANGHLEVVKWLHLNRSEGCTTAAMDCAAANGHLDIVRWLNTNRREGCTTKSVDGAAENGHLDVVKWLYRHQFMGCSRKAIDGALSNGHLRVANWLLAQFPSLTPYTVDLWTSPRAMFELVLFHSFHFGFGPGLQYAKKVLTDNLPDTGAKANQKHIIAWLEENCPEPEVEELDEEEEEEWWL